MNRPMKRHDVPPTWQSKVRGLMLGLALGDAVGSKHSDIPATGTLHAGAATQLAAWTTEGILRAATRYGGNIMGNSPQAVQYAYQRWAVLRGGLPSTPDWYPVFELDDMPTRGWLLDVPAMAEKRGSSPSTMTAILSGRPAHSQGCQGLLRTLPIAALAGTRRDNRAEPDQIATYARAVAEITHQHPRGSAAVHLAAVTAMMCLHEANSPTEAIRTSTATWTPREINTEIGAAVQQGTNAPCVPQTLERLAPDKTATSALAGGIYVVLSFPDPDTVAEALEFAGWAPDGDSVAAVAGAFLGATHGYQTLPTALTSRLELGWVIDQLATDLALQALQNQTGSGWKGYTYTPPADPWWDTRYPGV